MSSDPTAPEPLATPIERHLTTIFPTPVAIYPWPDSDALNADLARLVREEAARGPGLARSNVGGWHSEMDFLFRPEPALERLRGRIQSLTAAMTRQVMKPARHRVSVEGWANLLRAGQYNSLHLHPNSTWSGVYYVTGNPAPEAEGPGTALSGRFEFVDPRPGAAASYTVESTMQSRTILDPQAGTMILFPSWLQHQVHPYWGPGERISIAFNVLLTGAD